MPKLPKALVRILRWRSATVRTSPATPNSASQKASTQAPGSVPSGAKGGEYVREGQMLPINGRMSSLSASPSAPTPASLAAPKPVSVGGPSPKAPSHAPGVASANVELPETGGLPLSELVLLPLYPYTSEEMTDAVLESANFCERGTRPIIRVRTEPEILGPPAAVHAYLLVQWWKARGWKGEILARDLKKIYQEFCRQRGLEAEPWRRIAPYMEYYTNSCGRRYCRVGGSNLRVYPPLCDKP